MKSETAIEGQPATKSDGQDRRVVALETQLRMLDAQRRQLSALINHTDAGILVIDADLDLAWANLAARETYLTERNEEGPLGLPCNQLLCGKTEICPDCPARKAIKTEQVCHHEFRMFAGGRFRQVYATGHPVASVDGKIEQALVMLQDVSKLEVLRLSEEALRASEQRFRSIFERLPAGMVTVKANGSHLQVNPAFCTMLGYTESELLRMKLRDITHPDDVRALDGRFARAVKETQPVVESEQRFTRRDRTTLWARTTTIWQFDEGNLPNYGVILVQDVSERKQAKQELERSKGEYEALVNSIDGIVWEADPRNYQFSFVSQQAERILGVSVQRWLTQPRFWRNRIHRDDLDRVIGSFNGMLDDKRGCELEYRMIASDGHPVWLRDTVSVVVENDKVVKLRGLMVDVTERKEAEDALRQKEEQLRQSQKMEAVGKLAGGIAHDFNNLLTAITGYNEFLLRRLGSNHPLRREAEEIGKASQRAIELTGQLLAFSRRQVLMPKVLDLNAVVADMDAMLRRLLGEDIILASEMGEGLGALKADPGQIQQVILNLAVNARDAMPNGGQIDVETSNVEADEAYAAAHPGVEPGSYVMFAISDHGCGMDDETKRRLFEPFFTTKETGKGTGLGLSTVYGIVKQSSGFIWVNSEVDRGSTFQVYLPRVDEPLPEPETAAEAEPDLSPGTEMILLVEDDDAVRELAKEIFEMNGYTVIQAKNGVDALEVIASHDEQIDIMVTDLVMPRMGGQELARTLQPQRPDLKVLYLSGYTDSAVMQQGLLAPGSFFLQKPFTPTSLAKKVREILDS